MTNTHHDIIIDLLNHGMFENTKTWISWEWYITFLWSKKILNLCLRWHILRNYHFMAEVTFKNWMQKTLDTITGEKQKLLKIEYFYTLLLFITQYYIISLELIGILTFLLCISSDMEANSFIWLKMYTPTSSLKLK